MDFTQLFIYFITVNKYRFCILVIGYINVQIIDIGYKKIYIGRSLVNVLTVIIRDAQYQNRPIMALNVIIGIGPI